MRLNLKHKMIIILIVIIVLPISTLGVLSYMKAKSVFVEGFRAENEKIIKHTNDFFLEDFMNNIENNVQDWAENRILRNPDSTDAQMRLLKQEWNSFMKSKTDLLWIYFGRADGKFTIAPGNPKPPKDYEPRTRIWYREALKNKGKVIWTSPYRDAMSGQITVSAAIAVADQKTKKISGVLGIDFRLNRFSDAISDINKSYNGFTMIIDNKGTVLNHPVSSYLGSSLADVDWVKEVLESGSGSLIGSVASTGSQAGVKKEKEYYINYLTIKKTGWKLISLIPTSSMQQILVPIRDRTISVAIISIIIAFFIGYVLSDYIVRKLKNIISYMEQVEKGNLDIQSYYDGEDEFGILNKKFNSMALQISERMKEARLQSTLDGLTGLYNHKYIYEKLEEESKRAARYQGKLSIMMIDVDNFKDINDTLGHQAGDKALQVIANTIKGTLREIDVVGRYGGEEFMAILPEVGIGECRIAAERIRKNVDNLVWQYEKSHLTVSIGIAEMSDDNIEKLVGKADSLLYLAKERGKNRVEM